MKVATPFLLAVLSLSSLYVAPLINSPQGRAMAQDAAAQGRELATTTVDKGNLLVQDSQAKAVDLSSKARETTEGVQQRVKDMAQNGKQTVNKFSTQANDCATDVSRTFAENDESLRDMGIDALRKAPNTAEGSSGDAEQYTHRSASSTLDRGHVDYRYDTHEGGSNTSQFSTGIYDTPKQMATEGNISDKPRYYNTALENQDGMVSSFSN